MVKPTNMRHLPVGAFWHMANPMEKHPTVLRICLITRAQEWCLLPLSPIPGSIVHGNGYVEKDGDEVIRVIELQPTDINFRSSVYRDNSPPEIYFKGLEPGYYPLQRPVVNLEPGTYYARSLNSDGGPDKPIKRFQALAGRNVRNYDASFLPGKTLVYPLIVWSFMDPEPDPVADWDFPPW